MDADGDMDLVAGFASGGTIEWLENEDRTGTWGRHLVSDRVPGPWGIDTADRDSDGDVEILATSFDSAAILVFDVEGGTWTSSSVASCEGPLCAVFGDIDGRAGLDVVALSSWGDSVFWCRENQGTWESGLLGSGMVAPENLGCADFDSDGDIDVCAVSGSANELSWWENLGGGESFFFHNAGAPEGCSECSPGDLDSDGSPEIAVCSATDGSISYWEPLEYAGSGNLTSAILYLPGAPDGATLEWDAAVPPGTSMRVLARISPDRLRLGDWVELRPGAGNLDALLSPGDAFLQYRIEFSTTNRSATPEMRQIRVLTSDLPGI
jgi:hypothetical protein